MKRKKEGESKEAQENGIDFFFCSTLSVMNDLMIFLSSLLSLLFLRFCLLSVFWYRLSERRRMEKKFKLQKLRVIFRTLLLGLDSRCQIEFFFFFVFYFTLLFDKFLDEILLIFFLLLKLLFLFPVIFWNFSSTVRIDTRVKNFGLKFRFDSFGYRISKLRELSTKESIVFFPLADFLFCLFLGRKFVRKWLIRNLKLRDVTISKFFRN